MSQHVSVVIPTIDQPEELRECFGHLRNQTHDSFDVLVVDSGTGKNSQVVDSISSQLEAEMLSVPKNGLPRARNSALAYLDDTDIVAFCDPDARPTPGWLEALMAAYDDGVGAVGGPVLEPGESLRPRDRVGEIRPNGEITSNFDAENRRRVQHLRGTNMSFDVEIIRELGGFDPAYRGTGHFEDTDATYKVYRAGYDVVYTPEARLKHYHPPSDRDLESYHHYRLANWPIFFEKTSPSARDRLSFYVRLLARKGYFHFTA